MGPKWNLEEEKERYLQLWENRAHSGMTHTRAAWNDRAHKWLQEITDDNNIRKQRSEKRVQKTADYLRSKGLLQKEDSVIDIGCGLGRFVCEFAKTAGHAEGTDISDEMLKYGEEYARELGLSNTSFTVADFKTLDVREAGWEKAFDLCFSSITPAVSTWEAVQKMESMSRKYCFSSNFVYAEEELADEVLKEVAPGESLAHRWNGQTFYAMLNLLWLYGRFPEVTYYKEIEEERVPADEDLADHILSFLPEKIACERDRVIRFIKEKAEPDGTLLYRSARWYGWLLWDVNDSAPRNY